MHDICFKLLPLLEPMQGAVLGADATLTYIERFLDVCLKLNQGSTSSVKADRVVHPHTEKVQVLAGIFAQMDVIAAMYIIVDVWEESYGAFHKMVRSPARYGGFSQPNLCHMMSEQAVKDTVWYRKARADPKAHLPRLYRWLATPRTRAFADAMSPDKQARFKEMGAAFLKAAEEKHEKWNGTTWTRARHLLGTLCLEERRRWFAAELLQLLGHGGLPSAHALDDIDLELQAKLHAAHAGGSLGAELQRWKLQGPAFLAELRLLATTPTHRTEVDPALSEALTPQTFDAFKGMLFVRLAHNLLLESYVSRLATVEKTHPNTHALTLDHLFMYKARQADARAARLDTTMRSVCGGGLKPEAKLRIGRALSGSANRSKEQLLLLCSQTDGRGHSYSTKALHRRKAEGLWQRLRAGRERHDTNRANLAASHVAERRATCRTTATGRQRKAPPTAIACIRLLGIQPAPGAIVKHAKGNIYKSAATLKAGRAEMALHSKELRAAAKRKARTMARSHGSGKQERRAADAAARAAVPQPLAKRNKLPRAAGAAAAHAAAAVAAEEAASSDEEDEADGQMSEVSEDEADEADDINDLRAENTQLRSQLVQELRRPAATQAVSASPPPQATPTTPLQPELDPLDVARYKHLKHELKAFHAAFEQRCGRKASGTDVPEQMREVRRQYEHLKRVLQK